MSDASTAFSLTAMQVAESVRSGAMSASDAVKASLDAVEARNPAVNAFTDVTSERALALAQQVDADLASGRDLPLAGVPFAVKNLFDLEGVVTRAGSKINRENDPAREDGFLVRRLIATGAIPVGALNMGEYAYDFTGENAHDGTCCNPHDLGRMTGGSSSGSAAAVAGGLVPVSLGSDTNGSIRVPASFCGLFGLKPTYGRLSRKGTYPFCNSLDHLGPLARTVEDLSLFFDVMQGDDEKDDAQAPMPSINTLKELGKEIDGLRIVVAGGYFQDNAGPEALHALEAVAKAVGASGQIDIPEAARARAAAYVITVAEGASLHWNRILERPQDFDPDTRDRFISGTMVPALWLQQAQRFRSWFRAMMRVLFEEVDIILAPATPFPALASGTKSISLNGETILARPNIGIYTQPISFVGLPVVTVPVWQDGADLPIGVQVIAPAWHEDLALRVASHLERVGVCRAPIGSLTGEKV